MVRSTSKQDDLHTLEKYGVSKTNIQDLRSKTEDLRPPPNLNQGGCKPLNLQNGSSVNSDNYDVSVE